MKTENSSVYSLGYDPGGEGNNGVAFLELDGHTGQEKYKEIAAVSTPNDAIEWLVRRVDLAETFAVDTMMAWQLGDRPCDRWIRQKYVLKRPGVKVSSIGSLQGSMLAYGIMVAREVRKRKPDISLAEANPKPLRRALAEKDLGKDDHGEDAYLAAFAAGQWAAGQWTRDLFTEFPGSYWYPAGQAVYPWPD